MASLPFRRVAVLGTGLIGGSFALALRQAYPGVEVVGWDKPEVLSRAREKRAVDSGTLDIAAALRGADLIYVALPISVTIDLLPSIATHAASGSLVTDSGSTKAEICAAAETQFQGKARFLGGHPMAGKEASGIENADSQLFQGAKYVLIGTEADIDERLEHFAGLVPAIGAEPVWLDAETHDWAAAIVSHLPQLAAVALAGVVRDETDESSLPAALAGRGLRDMLRLAGSPYPMWRDTCWTNPDNIARALDRLAQELDHLRRNLKTRELEKEFAAANELYEHLRRMK